MVVLTNSSIYIGGTVNIYNGGTVTNANLFGGTINNNGVIVLPGKSIGGDVFRNAEGKLPSSPGRTWFEADINYTSGFRGSDRIIYSNDGLIYKTTDHYNTFTQVNK